MPEAHVGFLGAGLILQLLKPGTRTGGARGRPLGFISLSIGIALASWATLSVGSMDVAEPSAIVRVGPYRFSRNPMYIGWTLIYAGLALASRNRWLIRLLPGLTWTIHREVLDEERRLTVAFGEEYLLYSAVTPRYLGTVVPPAQHT